MKLSFALTTLCFLPAALARRLRAEDSAERKLQPLIQDVTIVRQMIIRDANMELKTSHLSLHKVVPQTSADELPESLFGLIQDMGPRFENFPEPGIAKKKFYIYLSGPEVFLPNAVEAGEIAKEQCASVNQPEWDFAIEAMYPLDKAIDNFGYNIETALRIYYANVDLMEKAHFTASHFTASNMVRFRSPSIDVGTAFEMGYVRALGKPVFGYYDVMVRLKLLEPMRSVSTCTTTPKAPKIDSIRMDLKWKALEGAMT